MMFYTDWHKIGVEQKVIHSVGHLTERGTISRWRWDEQCVAMSRHFKKENTQLIELRQCWSTVCCEEKSWIRLVRSFLDLGGHTIENGWFCYERKHEWVATHAMLGPFWRCQMKYWPKCWEASISYILRTRHNPNASKHFFNLCLMRYTSQVRKRNRL